MTLTYGVNVNITTVTAAPIPSSPTRGALFGVATGGTPSVAVNTATLVRNMTEFEEKLGAGGALHDYAREVFARDTAPLICARIADGLTGTPRQTAILAAITSISNFETRASLIAGCGETFVARNDGAASPIIAALKTAADPTTGLRAYILADAANSNVATAKAWSAANGGDRVIGLPQVITTAHGALPASIVALGDFLANDELHGIQDSLEQRNSPGITARVPAYGFNPFRESAEANDLARSNLFNYVAYNDAVWLRGLETKTTDATNVRRFYPVGRTMDFVEINIGDIAYRLVGRGIEADFAARHASNVNLWLERQVALGVIRSGVVSPDPTRNTPAALGNGLVYLIGSIRPVVPNVLVNIDLEVRL